MGEKLSSHKAVYQVRLLNNDTDHRISSHPKPLLITLIIKPSTGLAKTGDLIIN